MKIECVRVRRNGIVGVSGAVAIALVVSAGIISSISPRTLPGLLTSIVGFGWPVALALVAAWLGYWRPPRERARVEITEGALCVEGETLRAAGAITRGDATVLADGRVLVELRSRLRAHVRLEVPNITAARELLAALGLDRRAGTSQFQIRRLRRFRGLIIFGTFLGIPLTIALSIASFPIGLVAFLAVLLVPILDPLLARVELTVGTDGIGLRSVLRREFVPHARIRRIERCFPEGYESESTHEGEIVAWGFEIELDDGTKHEFDTRPERFPASVWQTDPIFDAAMAAWSAWKSGASSSVPTHSNALLARGGRSTREWIAALRDLAVDGASGYRVAALDERALFATLMDAAAARELRAAAAIALGVNVEHAPRLRVAADDVADPIVRRVAVACADPEGTASLEAALEEGFAVTSPLVARLRR